MLVTIQMQWALQYSSSSGSFYRGTGKAFNTDTHTIQDHNPSYNQAVLDPAPTNVPAPAIGAPIWYECGDAPDLDQTTWHYAGGYATTTTVEHNSPFCGWTPPAPPGPTCDLVLTLAVNAAGDTITATVTGAHGTVTYSRDGGQTRQASPVFGPLAPGTYPITAYDGGVTACYRTVSKTLTSTVPVVLPTAVQLPAVGFSRNPLALEAQATVAGRALVVELFAEHYHGSNTYERVVQRLRPTDAQGRAVLELQDQLHALLTPELPELSLGLSLRRLRGVIRRYFVQLAEVQAGSHQPGPARRLPVATVLRGGLGWEPARAGELAAGLPVGFLTWRPAGEQLVGRGHVLLLAALVEPEITDASLLVRCYRRGGASAFHTKNAPLALPGRVLGQAATPFLVQAQVPTGELPADTYRVQVQLITSVAGQATGGEGYVPPTRTFRLDDTAPRRQYVFLNSLGQWDTLSCAGLLASKASVERTVATTLVPPDYAPAAGREGVVAVSLDDRVTVGTGHLAPAEVAYLRELWLSQHVYELAGGRLRKIRLTGKDLLDYQDNAGQDGFPIEYAYCFDTTLYDPNRLPLG